MMSALIPFISIYQKDINQSQFEISLGDKILICTADGFEWVDRDTLPAHHKHAKCPLCYLPDDYALVAVPTDHIENYLIFERREWHVVKQLALSFTSTSPPSRAPPAV